MMKVFVDKNTCIGCGVCEGVCPELFKMDDEGKAEALAPETEAACAQDAADSCPVQAIKID